MAEKARCELVNRRENDGFWKGQGNKDPCILFSVVFNPSLSSHRGKVWVLPVISILLTNSVSPVRACLSIWWERFRGDPKTRQSWWPLSIQSFPGQGISRIFKDDICSLSSGNLFYGDWNFTPPPSQGRGVGTVQGGVSGCPVIYRRCLYPVAALSLLVSTVRSRSLKVLSSEMDPAEFRLIW